MLEICLQVGESIKERQVGNCTKQRPNVCEGEHSLHLCNLDDVGLREVYVCLTTLYMKTQAPCKC